MRSGSCDTFRRNCRPARTSSVQRKAASGPKKKPQSQRIAAFVQRWRIHTRPARSGCAHGHYIGTASRCKSPGHKLGGKGRLSWRPLSLVEKVFGPFGRIKKANNDPATWMLMHAHRSLVAAAAAAMSAFRCAAPSTSTARDRLAYRRRMRQRILST